MRLVVLAAAVALAVYKFMTDQNPTPDNLTDPAGRLARARAAFRSVESRAVQQQILEAWARLETGDFKTVHGHSLFNIHVGSGAGDWNGKVAGTDGGAPLRDYDSYEQSVRDVLLLMKRVPSVYADALNAYDMGDVTGFFAAIARGNGTEGFVGPSNTTKARNYTAGLNRVYNENFA